MAWTAPASYTTGEVVTASKLNAQVYNNLRYLKGLDGFIVLEDGIGFQDNPATPDLRGSFYISSSQVFLQAQNVSTLAFLPINFNGSLIAMRPNNTEMARFTTTGLGVGTTNPLTRFQAVMGPGGFATWGGTSVSTSSVTVIGSGVTRRAAGHITAWHSGGTGGGASFSIGSGTTTVYNDGTNTVTLTITGGGSLTVQRGAGSGTFDVTLAFTYQ